jgi:hypothetical protein
MNKVLESVVSLMDREPKGSKFEKQISKAQIIMLISVLIAMLAGTIYGATFIPENIATLGETKNQQIQIREMTKLISLLSALTAVLSGFYIGSKRLEQNETNEQTA